MKMKWNTRVLIVEDDPMLRGQYREHVERLNGGNVEVDTASNRNEALERVNQKTYHVALIDIMLNGPDDEADRGGMDVMARLQELDEGTQMIVLSGAREVEVPVEAWLKYRACSYIMKKKVRSRADILEPIQQALGTSSGLKVYGRFRSLIDYLAVNQTEMVWVDRALRTLKTMDGWSGLNAFVSGFFGTLAPLLPRRGVKTVSEIDPETGLLRANLWSKATGSELILFARHAVKKGEGPAPVPDRTAELVWEYNRAFVDGWAYSVADSERADFVDKIHDVIPLKDA